MLRFLKPEVVGDRVRDLLTIEINKADNQLPAKEAVKHHNTMLDVPITKALLSASRKYKERLNEEIEAAEKPRPLQDKNIKQKQEAQEEAKLMKKNVLEIGEKAIETKDNLYQE